MIALNSIINTFTTDEQQQFISFLERKNKRQDTKNIRLFQLLVKGQTDSKTICLQLYNTEQTNAYHALRKRLFESLIEFSANKSLADENSVEMKLIKLILAARTLLLQNNFNTAYKILDKAERLADEYSLYPILNEIYHTKIQYASSYSQIKLDAVIEKQKANQKKHQLEDELNIVYAKLKSKLNAINKSHKIVDFETVLKTTISNYGHLLNESLSFKSLYQFLAIANISALVTTTYFEIEAFVLKSYTILKAKKDTDKQLYYQIYIVYFIANTLFRNRKFEASLSYIDEMQTLMLLKRKTYYKTFILKHNLVKALNLNFSNKQEQAITLITSAIKIKHNDLEAVLDLHLALVMFHFQANNFNAAKQTLSQFYHTDKWYIDKASIDWLIKKYTLDILLRIELGDDDLLESRVKSFKRNFKVYLKNINQDYLMTFLNHAVMIYKYPEKLKLNSLPKEVEEALYFKDTSHHDIFTISLYAWLKNKYEGKSLYATTLALLKKA